MVDKYKLTRKQSVFLAKKNIVGAIYSSAKIEGCNVTFPQTETILNGITPGGVNVDDVYCILNLRDAWKFTLSNLDHPMDLELLKRINSYVSKNESLEWGVLRTGNVGISGVDYTPSIPNENDVLKKIKELEDIECVTDRALTFMLWGMRQQLFWDGNKRTMTIAANHILIQNGAGVLSIDEKHIEEFSKLLTEYYESNDMTDIKNFLYNQCIYGITFQKQIEIPDKEKTNDNYEL